MHLELEHHQPYVTAYGSLEELSRLRAAAAEAISAEWGVPAGELPLLIDDGPELCEVAGRELYRLDMMTGLLPGLLASGRISADKPEALPHPADLFETGRAGFSAVVAKGLLALRAGGLLWPHQAEAVQALLLAPAGRGIAAIATGGGKTRLAAAIMVLGRLLIGGPWVYVVTNEALAQQTARAAQKDAKAMLAALDAAGFFEEDLADEDWLDSDSLTAGLEFMTYTQLAKADSWVYDLRVCGADETDLGGLLVDECHASAPLRRATSIINTRALWHLGMSATPQDRQDWKNALVVGMLGPVVYTADVAALTRAGVLAPGRVINV